MLKNCLIKCPWCQGTGRENYDGRPSVFDDSNRVLPDEDMCPKCSGRKDKNTIFGGGWLNIDSLFN